LVAEAAGCIAEEALRVFVHKWTEEFWKRNWDEWCTLPATGNELGVVMNIFERVGFPGCLGSMDVVHVAWAQCPAAYRALHTGKEGSAACRKQLFF
jgi:hypothetical protein